MHLMQQDKLIEAFTVISPGYNVWATGTVQYIDRGSYIVEQYTEPTDYMFINGYSDINCKNYYIYNPSAYHSHSSEIIVIDKFVNKYPEICTDLRIESLRKKASVKDFKPCITTNEILFKDCESNYCIEIANFYKNKFVFASYAPLISWYYRGPGAIMHNFQRLEMMVSSSDYEMLAKDIFLLYLKHNSGIEYIKNKRVYNSDKSKIYDMLLELANDYEYLS